MAHLSPEAGIDDQEFDAEEKMPVGNFLEYILNFVFYVIRLF